MVLNATAMFAGCWRWLLARGKCFWIGVLLLWLCGLVWVFTIVSEEPIEPNEKWMKPRNGETVAERQYFGHANGTDLISDRQPDTIGGYKSIDVDNVNTTKSGVISSVYTKQHADYNTENAGNTIVDSENEMRQDSQNKTTFDVSSDGHPAKVFDGEANAPQGNLSMSTSVEPFKGNASSLPFDNTVGSYGINLTDNNGLNATKDTDVETKIGEADGSFSTNTEHIGGNETNSGNVGNSDKMNVDNVDVDTVYFDINVDVASDDDIIGASDGKGKDMDNIDVKMEIPEQNVSHTFEDETRQANGNINNVSNSVTHDNDMVTTALNVTENSSLAQDHAYMSENYIPNDNNDSIDVTNTTLNDKALLNETPQDLEHGQRRNIVTHAGNSTELMRTKRYDIKQP